MNAKGRFFRTAIYYYFFLHIASCTSAASMTVLLQSPAFHSSTSERQEVDLLFFDCCGAEPLDAYQRSDLQGQIYAVCGGGDKRIVALSRAPRDSFPYAHVRNYGDIRKYCFSLDDESPAAPRLFGETRVEDGLSRTGAIHLQAALCSITLRSLACDFSARPYAGAIFRNTRLFLSYAGTGYLPLQAGSAPVSWLNAGWADSLSCNRLPYPEMVLQDGVGPVGDSRVLTQRQFCCYPNPTQEESLGQPCTRLVLEGDIGDVHCYYPLTLPAMTAGSAYTIDVTLLRMGTPEPDIPAEPGMYQLEMQTKPWEDREPQTILF